MVNSLGCSRICFQREPTDVIENSKSDENLRTRADIKKDAAVKREEISDDLYDWYLGDDDGKVEGRRSSMTTTPSSVT
jgi:hypothetical protein